MPIPVTAWVSNIFPTAKSLNMALYTTDGSADNPNGIAFHAFRPLFFENYTKAQTFTTSSTGVQTNLNSFAGTASSCQVIYDTAGLYGQTSDSPGLGYYGFSPAINGAAGDGITSGGWSVMCHMAPIKSTATQTSVSADMNFAGSTASTFGSRQAPNNPNDSCPIFIDLINSGENTWEPAVTIRDSGSASATNTIDTTDSSGEAARFLTLWAAVSATTQGNAFFSPGGSYNWTAPNGVSSVTVSAFGGGAGAGAGNVSGGGAEFGGGGGGGGEYAAGALAVTGGNNYPVTVGAGGPGGTNPGGNGTAGGNSAVSGDAATITGHGGSAGVGATTLADGAGGAGGTGAGGTHFNGGSGATGTGTYGGGGGSSAGTGSAGNNASANSGGAAVVGGGPGGSGGLATFGVVQTASGSHTSSGTLGISFNSLQSGNTIVICVTYSAAGAGSDPTCTLSDGTNVPEDVSAQESSGTAVITSIYHLSNVSGGQDSVNIVENSGTNIVKLAQIYEISGLGPTPNVDASNTSTNSGSGAFSVSQAMAAAPDLWVGAIGASNTSVSFDISINSGNGWNTNIGQNTNSQNGNFVRLRSGYQFSAVAGTATWSGTENHNCQNASVVVGITASTTTPGTTPVLGPSGGGGAGLGDFDAGSGLDGQVSLTWTGVSGGGYSTPQVPAPFSSWGPGTTIGSSNSSGANVNINGPNGITDVVNFMANPPVFRIASGSAQSLTTSTLTNLTFSTVSANVDSYAGWSASTYTIPRSGMYLFHGTVAFAANTTGARICGANINGTTYWGPGYRATTSGTTNCTKTQIFSLNAGDTVKLSAWQNSGGSLALDTTAQTRFMLAWVNNVGQSTTARMPPDTTFRWASGTPAANLPALFQQFLGNDLNFLSFRPYFMGYQGSSQSTLSTAAFNTLTMDTVGGIVHSDQGDNYGGWTTGASNKYTAMVNGWYLVTGEVFASSSAASSASTIAVMKPSTSGGYTPHVAQDLYQANASTSTGTVGGGATVFGLYYLLAGETLTPQIETLSYTTTYGTMTGTQNTGKFASHLEILWVSE